MRDTETLSLCLNNSVRREGVEVRLHGFLTSTVDTREGSPLHPGGGEKSSCRHWTQGKVGPKAIRSCWKMDGPETELSSLIVQATPDAFNWVP
jgi:hypothetical protein